MTQSGAPNYACRKLARGNALKHTLRFLLFLISISAFASGNAFATTYYVSTAGSDTNNGTSTATPWLHAKGMSGCTSNCNSSTPKAGDKIILRGGDVWHWNAGAGVKGLPWKTVGTGTASSPIYYGVDHTWWNATACGSSWCRPVLNGDNPLSTTAVGSCGTGNATNSVMLDDATTFGVLDDFEMVGLCWSDNPIPFFGDSFIAIDSTNGTYSNIYVHGWTHTKSASSQATGWAGSTDGRVTHFDSIVVDGSDSDPGSLCSLCFDVYDVHNSVFRYNSNFVGNGASLLYNNLFEFITEPYDSAHGNVSEWNNEANSNGGNYIYNNLVRHTTTAVTMWVCPQSANLQDYYFNNVMYDISSQMWDFANDGGAGCGAGGTGNFVNNTFVSGSLGKAGSWLGTFTNNYMIGSTILGTVTSQKNQVTATATQASTYGYTTGNNYGPASADCNGNSSASGCPIGKGSNLTSVCNSIGGLAGAALCKDTTLGPNYDAVRHRVNGNARTPVARPSNGAWDAGSFQFGQSVSPAPPTGLAGVVK
jgi:hypothetical protein